MQDYMYLSVEVALLEFMVNCLCFVYSIHFFHPQEEAFSASECDVYGMPNASACTSLSWAFKNSSYTPENYIGSACSTHLLEWQDCAVGPTDSGIVTINASQDQSQTEQLLIETLQMIGQIFACAVLGLTSYPGVLIWRRSEEERPVHTVVCMHLISNQLFCKKRKMTNSRGLGFIDDVC